MTHHRVLPIWSDASGSDTGPIAILCATRAAIDDELSRWMRSHGRRAGFRMLLLDDVAWRTVAKYRLRMVVPQTQHTQNHKEGAPI